MLSLFSLMKPTKTGAAQILAGCLWLGGVGVTSAADFYLSPTGNDANPGTESAPFATLDRARQAVRTVNGAMTGDIVVHLAPGDYPTTSPVIFGADDSGMNGHRVIYRASGAPGSARLIGGMQVTNWEPYDVGELDARRLAREFTDVVDQAVVDLVVELHITLARVIPLEEHAVQAGPADPATLDHMVAIREEGGHAGVADIADDTGVEVDRLCIGQKHRAFPVLWQGGLTVVDRVGVGFPRLPTADVGMPVPSGEVGELDAQALKAHVADRVGHTGTFQ